MSVEAIAPAAAAVTAVAGFGRFVCTMLASLGMEVSSNNCVCCASTAATARAIAAALAEYGVSEKKEVKSLGLGLAATREAPRFWGWCW